MIGKVKKIIEICEIIENKGYNVFVDYSGHVKRVDVRIDSLKSHQGDFDYDYNLYGYIGLGHNEFPLDELKKLAEELKETVLK